LFLEPSVANPPDEPCASDFKQLTKLDLGIVRTGVLTAKTVLDPGGVPGGHAESSVADPVITLPGLKITASVLSAEAAARCAPQGKPHLASSSTVLGVVINGGTVIDGSGPVTIPLGPVTVYLNRKIYGPGDKITQRALEVVADLPFLGKIDVVAGEAKANVKSCDP
jgi:hypothetical protein